MELEKRVLSGREKDEASIKLLRKLRELLFSSDASNRRRAAYKLPLINCPGCRRMV